MNNVDKNHPYLIAIPKTILYSVYGMKLNLMMRLQSRILGNMEYSFITITLRSLLISSGSTC